MNNTVIVTLSDCSVADIPELIRCIKLHTNRRWIDGDIFTDDTISITVIEKTILGNWNRNIGWDEDGISLKHRDNKKDYTIFTFREFMELSNKRVDSRMVIVK